MSPISNADDPDPSTLALMVDDDADTREMYRLSLGWNGLAVEVACDGEEAWQKTQVLLPDVVVTDIRLPRFDGFALCRKIKAESRTAHIPVIALTGWSVGSIEEKANGAFQAVLLKPVLPEVLIEQIQKVLAQSRLLREESRLLRQQSRVLRQESRLLRDNTSNARSELQRLWRTSRSLRVKPKEE